MDTYTRLYLIRHGQVVNFDTGVFNGHNDVDLSDLGMRQMEAAARRLSREAISAVYCSDLIRSRKGAEIIAAEHGLVPEVSRNLRELDFGIWAGLTFMQIEEAFPGAMAERSKNILEYKVPGGESGGDMKRRIMAKVEQILHRHDGRHIVLVVHGGVNRVILTHVLSLDLKNFYSIDQEYGCLNIIDFYHDFAVIKLVNGRPETDY